jgi:ribosomal protein L11 methylase PrmA
MKIAASFRDPSGFLFREKGKLYRQINFLYKKHYDQLMKSGLYEKLIKTEMLIPHEEVNIKSPEPKLVYKILQPEEVPFISYPYEWSFHTFKDAALATLRIQKHALDHGMTLKDASAYNLQLLQGRMHLIDSLSFELYEEGKPWIAYKQFCQHFLAPIALMTYTDIRLTQLLRIYIDGIPLDLATKLLPVKARFNFGLLSHIYAHSIAQKQYSDKEINKSIVLGSVSKVALYGLINSLEKTIRNLEWKSKGTEWANYYHISNYSDKALNSKGKIVTELIRRTKPITVWDLGANNGLFSRIASDQGILTVAFDIDPSAVDSCYLQVKAKKEKNLLPFILDLSNPSGGIGWANRERFSLSERGPVDLVLALALIHHLAISNNVPLDSIASFFSELSKWLIIEFVPKEDSQVQKLLANREDIFFNYSKTGFEQAFKLYFSLESQHKVMGSLRTIYLFRKKSINKLRREVSE